MCLQCLLQWLRTTCCFYIPCRWVRVWTCGWCSLRPPFHHPRVPPGRPQRPPADPPPQASISHTSPGRGEREGEREREREGEGEKERREEGKKEKGREGEGKRRRRRREEKEKEKGRRRREEKEKEKGREGEGEGKKEKGRGGKKGGQRKGSKRLQYITYMCVVCHSLVSCIEGYHANVDQACIAGTELVADMIRLSQSHPPFLLLPAQWAWQWQQTSAPKSSARSHRWCSP